MAVTGWFSAKTLTTFGMGEGGAVYTNNPLLHKIVRSLRDWGRDCVCPPGKDNLCGHRYDGDFGLLPKGYDHKYVYSHFGYNLKATDMQAAVGCAQLRKLPGFTLKRIDNFKRLKNRLLCISDKVILPEALPGSEPSWFGFLVTCRDCVDRNAVVEHLEAQNVQTRMGRNLFGKYSGSGMLASGQVLSGVDGAYHLSKAFDISDMYIRGDYYKNGH